MKRLLLWSFGIGALVLLVSIWSHARDLKECLSLEAASACRECVTDVCAEELRKLDNEVGYSEAKKAFDAARQKIAIDKSAQASVELENAKNALDKLRQIRSTSIKTSPCIVEGEKLKRDCDKKP